MAIDFPANPTNGQVYGNWIYDSSITAWRNVNTDTGIGTLNAMGLKNVVPTSVAVGSGSATVNGNGTVSFSGATSISLNEIFNSTYQNYMVNLVTTAASVGDATIFGRLRVAGSDSAVSYYEGGPMTIGATATSINNLNINQWDMGKTHGATSEPNAHAALNCKFFQPFLPRPTTFFTESTSWTGSAMAGYRFGGFHTALTSYTGFTFSVSSGNFSGTLSVYGYNQ